MLHFRRPVVQSSLILRRMFCWICFVLGQFHILPQRKSLILLQYSSLQCTSLHTWSDKCIHVLRPPDFPSVDVDKQLGCKFQSDTLKLEGNQNRTLATLTFLYQISAISGEVSVRFSAEPSLSFVNNRPLFVLVFRLFINCFGLKDVINYTSSPVSTPEQKVRACEMYVLLSFID